MHTGLRFSDRQVSGMTEKETLEQIRNTKSAKRRRDLERHLAKIQRKNRNQGRTK